MTDHDTESRLADALREHPTATPDLDRLSAHAVRGGTRIRRRRQGLVVLAAAALVGAGSVVVTVAGGGDRDSSVPVAAPSTPVASDVPTTTPTPPAVTPTTTPPGTDTTDAYAVLDAPGWLAPEGNVIADEKLYYVGPGDTSVSLNWRPADTYTGKWDRGPRDAVIDGDPAAVVEEGGSFTVVGPVRAGRFLTLTGVGLTEQELVDLALDVRRQ